MKNAPSTIELDATIPETLDGRRLDQALSQLFPEHSRMRLKTWILDKAVTVNGNVLKPKEKVRTGDTIAIHATITAQVTWHAEPIDLAIVFEDEHIIVLNKPVGIVVHPAAGHHDGTLVNALLHHAPSLENLPRAGIIHRLDKDTSGLLIVAKTLEAHTALIQMMQAREIKREYLALVHGMMITGTSIDKPIGRHPTQRKKMAIIPEGKPAVTHVKVLDRFPKHTLTQVQLETGRTHQIRVHLTDNGFPLVGDQTYGRKLVYPPKASEPLKEAIQKFKHQALHAWKLTFEHPKTHKILALEAPLPNDFDRLLTLLKTHRDETS